MRKARASKVSGREGNFWDMEGIIRTRNLENSDTSLHQEKYERHYRAFALKV